jgi:hypothetical protein
MTANVPATIPKGWKKTSQSADRIIIACPFCNIVGTATNE